MTEALAYENSIQATEYALADIARHAQASRSQKATWIIVIAVGLVTAAVIFFAASNPAGAFVGLGLAGAGGLLWAGAHGVEQSLMDAKRMVEERYCAAGFDIAWDRSRAQITFKR